MRHKTVFLPFGIAGALSTVSTHALAQETCYVSMAISTELGTTSSRKLLGQIDEGRDVPLVVFHADIFETPCPERGQSEPAKQDVRVQFYEAIKARYPQIAEQIRGAWRDIIIFTPTRDRVFDGHDWWEPQGPYDDSHADHAIFHLEDFSYQAWNWRDSDQRDARYQAYSKWKRDKKYRDQSR